MNASKKHIGSGLFNIPKDELRNAEKFCLENLHMDKRILPEKYQSSYNYTHAEALKWLDCKGMYKGFPIESVEDGKIRLSSGTVLESEVLAREFAGAKEMVVFAVAVHGFEELCKQAGNSGLEVVFYSGWGVGFSTNSQQWIENAIRERAHSIGLYSGKSWSPGEEDVDMSLQAPLDEMLNLSRIGLTLKSTGVMQPAMSVTGFIAVSDDPDLELQETSWMVV